MLVEIVPMFYVARNPRTLAKVFIGICIDASSVRRVGARRFADAFSGGAVRNRFGTNPLVAQGTVFTAGFTQTSELLSVKRTHRIPKFIEIRVRGFGISFVKRDTGSFKVEFIFQHGIVIVRIAGGIAQEC